MKRSATTIRRLLVATIFLLLLGSVDSRAQAVRDSVEVIETPAGRYLCCYDFIVYNRHDTNVRISEFRVRILSGRAKFIAGQIDAPPNWTALFDSVEVRWFSNGAAYDVYSGRSVSGFHVCPRDTGVFSMVWETRNVDSVLTRDTLTFACRGVDCDEAFFSAIPSRLSCGFDVDVAIGNRTSRPVNEFMISPITRGVTLVTAPSQQPAGWTRLRSRADSIVWFTTNDGLDFGDFRQGFRFYVNAPADTPIRIVWRTRSFGEVFCYDTVTLRCGLTAGDSVRITSSADSCCQDLRLKNAHQPSSPLTLFTIRMQTAGATISGSPLLPQGWSQRYRSPSGDSLALAAPGELKPGDTALIRSLCFTNAAASSDTIRYRWTTFSGTTAVDTGRGSIICLRPLTRCDSVGVRVDSTYPAAQRCIYLTLANQNSRSAVITRFVARISNPGLGRVILTATPPGGFVVESKSADSVVFTSDGLYPDEVVSPFTLCLSTGDTAMRDPLTIRWRTANGLGSICSGTLQTNAVISSDCDSVLATPISSSDTTLCCFGVTFLNRNGKNRPFDRAQLEVGLPVIFASATASGAWSVETAAFPSFDVAFAGPAVLPDSASPTFNVCLDLRQVPNRPFTVPVIWRTFQGTSLVCVDTLRLVCSTAVTSRCDTAAILGQGEGAGSCIYALQVTNLHTPAEPIDRVRLTLGGNPDARISGALAQGGAAGFAQIDVEPRRVTWRGGTIASGAALDTFVIRVDSADGRPLTAEVCTMIGDRVVCCTTLPLTCQTSSVEREEAGSFLSLGDPRPNPTRGEFVLPVSSARGGEVLVRLVDAAGRAVYEERRVVGSGRSELRLDLAHLPSGSYRLSLSQGATSATLASPLVIVR